MDFYFSKSQYDVNLLSALGKLAEENFSPIISAASPGLFNFESWQQLDTPIKQSYLLDNSDFKTWNNLRKQSHAKFIYLTLPRVLARSPYKKTSDNIDEWVDGAESQFCWMNAACCKVSCITKAFSRYTSVTTIRGSENGGKLCNLPLYNFHSDNGLVDYHCPTEIGVTCHQET